MMHSGIDHRSDVRISVATWGYLRVSTEQLTHEQHAWPAWCRRRLHWYLILDQVQQVDLASMGPRQSWPVLMVVILVQVGIAEYRMVEMRRHVRMRPNRICGLVHLAHLGPQRPNGVEI
jgi:hypothetical protein